MTLQRSPEASRRLTANEARLVEAMTEAAERNITLSRRELAALSGYGDSESGRVQVSRALARPEVRQALIEAAQGILATGAPTAAAMIRGMAASRDSAQAHAARVDLLKLVGMGASEPQSGASVAIALVLPSELAAPLAQYAARGPQVIDGTAREVGTGPRAEGAGRKPGPKRAARDPSPPASGKAPAKGRGGRKPRRRAVARGRREITPSSGDVSGGGTGEG